MKKAITYFVVFLFYQVIGGAIVGVAIRLLDLGDSTDTMTLRLVAASAVASLATLVTFFWAKWCPVSRDYLRSKPFSVLFWTILLSLGLITPINWCTEQLPEIMTKDMMGDVFSNLMRKPEGYLLIGLIAPFVEEVVFRGAILRKLLEWLSGNPSNLRPGMSYENDGNTCLTPKARWIAIGISALFFSIAHMNPAQMPAAFVIGLLLGWMYYRTGSIIPGIVYHWVNNSAAFAIAGCFPMIPYDAKMSAYFGSNEHTVLMAVGFSLLIALPSLWQLHLLMKK